MNSRYRIAEKSVPGQRAFLFVVCGAVRKKPDYHSPSACVWVRACGTSRVFGVISRWGRGAPGICGLWRGVTFWACGLPICALCPAPTFSHLGLCVTRHVTAFSHLGHPTTRFLTSLSHSLKTCVPRLIPTFWACGLPICTTARAMLQSKKRERPTCQS
jgi:hypothetical protein